MKTSDKVGIRCRCCNKIVHYYDNRLYKIIIRFGAKKQLHIHDDNYRYCSKECAEKIAKQISNIKKGDYIIESALIRSNNEVGN